MSRTVAFGRDVLGAPDVDIEVIQGSCEGSSTDSIPADCIPTGNFVSWSLPYRTRMELYKFKVFFCLYARKKECFYLMKIFLLEPYRLNYYLV